MPFSFSGLSVILTETKTYKMRKIAFLLLLVSASAQAQNFEMFVNDLEIFWTNRFNETKKTYQKPIITVVENDYNLYYKDGIIRISKPLIRDLQNARASDSFFYFILAHEYGHSVLFQLNEFPLISALREYQADCLAGAYFRQKNLYLDTNEILKLFNVLNDESNKLNFRNIFLDGHGTNFKRIEAIEKGFQTGNLNACINDYKIKY